METQALIKIEHANIVKPFAHLLRNMPGDTQSALSSYYAKLDYETDSSNVFADRQDGITDFMVIDVGSVQSYENELTACSINLPPKQTNDITTASLPKDKVMYYHGIDCNDSTKGAPKVVSLGFGAKELLGGIDR